MYSSSKTLCKLTDDTKMCGVVKGLEGRDAIQRNLDRFERWECVNVMKFNKPKCRVFYLGQDNPKHKYRGWIKPILGISLWRKDFGVFVDENLNMTQRCAFTSQKSCCILGCIKRSMASKPKEVMLPLYSVLVRPLPEYSIQLWGPSRRKTCGTSPDRSH
ncbi:hypothetical protein WISP_63365 [Willisornis vidua]|uniref:Uncharacterized protein n=1 Tax=Willisornis vidua TaxID=1566151 RepID=A0ABQ9DEG4_9PASS|nr:hypothetical protein WISP_63365 [Willisornis vidua]